MKNKTIRIKAIREDGLSLLFLGLNPVRDFFGRLSYSYNQIVAAIENGKPLFKDGKKYFLDEDFDYEPERDS